VAAALGGFTGAGCSSGSSGPDAAAPTTAKAVDTQDVESLLVANQKRASPEFDVGAASCPARVVVTEGTTFQCTVVVEGVVVPYDVTLTDVNGTSKTGGFDIRPAKAILSIPKLVDALGRNAPGTRIDCGPERVRVYDVGATFDCQAIDAQGAHPITLRVNDIHGNVTQVGAP
jgi:uncharacterized metal-binding protein